MEFIGDLVGGQGCAADGTTAARNPVSHLVSSLMEGAAPSAAGGKQRGAPAAGAYRGYSAPGPPPAQMEALQRSMAEGMAMGHVGLGPPPPQFMRGGIFAPPPPDAWAHEFGGMQGPMHPPQQFRSSPHVDAAMEAAWREQAAAEQWAMEFGRAPQMAPPPPHVLEMHRRQMEAAWADQMAARRFSAPQMMAAGPQMVRGVPTAVDQPFPQAHANQFQSAWAGAGPAMTPAELDAAWADGDTEVKSSGEGSVGVQMAGAWAAAAPAATAADVRAAEAQAQGASSAAGLEQADSDAAGFDCAWSEINTAMESAWREARAAADPELEKVWEEGEAYEGVGGSAEGMNAAWERTAARLEAMGSGNEGAYDFQTGNPRLEEAAQAAAALGDFFAEGLRHYEAGNIAEAVLCFEAELKKDPSHSEAWRMLGQSHAENDQDPLAIACLERAVEQDPYNLEALLALGVSYVNELDSQKALATLRAWVRHNPKYAGLEVAADEYSDGTLMDEVMQLMLQAERWDGADADAKVVLGVLYNVSRDYGSAADAFRAALAARPNDHSLWNKLGATLANDSRSGDALPAYARALSAKPRYARAWLNSGISHANLNQYDAAAACYLRALRLNPAAKHVWSYLRIVFTCMERFDLVQRAGTEDPDAFAGEFNEEGLLGPI